MKATNIKDAYIIDASAIERIARRYNRIYKAITFEEPYTAGHYKERAKLWEIERVLEIMGFEFDEIYNGKAYKGVTINGVVYEA